MQLLLKALMTLGLKLLTTAAIEDLVIFAARKLAEATDSKADDELVALLEKHLK